jgi:hypothetical protein
LHFEQWLSKKSINGHFLLLCQVFEKQHFGKKKPAAKSGPPGR